MTVSNIDNAGTAKAGTANKGTGNTGTGNTGVGHSAGPDPDLAAPGAAQHSDSGHTQARKAVGLVLVLTAGLSLVLALFVGIAVNSGPNGIRLAVAGPPAAVEQIQAGLAQSAGPDAFEVTVIGDESAARSALADRSADGAIIIGPSGATLLTAGAGSPAITQLLTTAAARLGEAPAAGPAVIDVVPLPSTDSRGVGLAAGSFPMIIAGLALGAASALTLRSRWWVLGTAVGGATAIGSSFAGVLVWLGVSAGNYVAQASAISLTVAASALVVAGFIRLVGAAGAGLGGLLLVILGNPLSGISTSPRLLPAPWGDLGQWLPTGAGGTLLRSAAYFPGASVWEPVLVLLGWAALGAIGVIVGRRAGRTEPVAGAA